MTEKDIDRFWSKVNKDGPMAHIPKLGKCWVWMASLNSGYGQMQLSNPRRVELAHRISWSLHFGNIGKCVLHKCDNPRCVKPEHLFEGTRTENMTDKIAKGRQTIGEANGPSKLTTKQVHEIIQRRKKTGEYHRVIAKDYGVSRELVRDIVNGKAWRHIKSDLPRSSVTPSSVP